MAYSANEFVVDPPLGGVDLNEEATDGNPKYALGTRVLTNLGNMYRYVGYAAAKTAARVYEITEDWLVTDLLTKTTDGDAPLALGVFKTTTTAPAGTVTTNYGWIQTAGIFPAVGLLISCKASTELMTNASAGKLDDSSGVVVHAIKATASITAAANQECFSHCELYIPTDA